MAIKITGASQRVREQMDGWEAWYECHKCGNEFACVERHECEKTAREWSDWAFDRQQRRYCYRCGYKLSAKNDIPESEYIAGLNQIIDELHVLLAGIRRTTADEREERFSKAVETAVEMGWIEAVDPLHPEFDFMEDT